MTGQELDTSIAETDSQLSEEDLAIKQQVEADTNVFSGNMGIDLSEPEYPLTPTQQETVNSTKLVPQEDGEGYRVSETYKATTPYGKMANEQGIEAADAYFKPVAIEAANQGKTVEDIESKLGIKQYKADAEVIDNNNKNEVDTIVASHSEYNSSLTQTAQDMSDDERLKLNSIKTIEQLETKGYVFDPKTGKMTKDGNEYDLEGSFAKNMEAHQAQVMFGILGTSTGWAVSGGIAAYAGEAMGSYVGEIVDNVKLKRVTEEGNESVTDEPKTMGDTAREVWDANRQAAIATDENIGVGIALDNIASAVVKGWRHFSAPTKRLVQDIKAGNINTAFDNVIVASTKSTDEIVDETIDLLSVTEGGDALLADIGKDILKKVSNGVKLTPEDMASLPVDFKRATVNKELMTNPDLKAELNQVLSDPDAISKMSTLIRQHTDALNKHFKNTGLDSIIDDSAKGITFKQKLDRALEDTLDILDMSSANLASATKHNKLNPFSLTNLTDSITKAIRYLKPEIDASMNMVGADTRTLRLADVVMNKASNLSDMSSLLDFRKSYNELLRQLKVYDNVPYDKTMRGNKVKANVKVEKTIALQVKEDIDALIRQTVEESPMTTADKKSVLKNWEDTNTLANKVYETRATDLYKAISKAGKDSTQIADEMLKSIGKQGGDYSAVMAHLSPEQAIKFEENLVVRAIEKATDLESGLIDYRTLAKRLQGLANNTANEATRNSIEIVNTYAKLFGSDADIYKSLTNMKTPSGFSQGLSRTIAGFIQYTGIGLVKHFMQMNYLAGKRFIGDIIPITKQILNIPLVGKYAGRIDKTVTDYATSQAILDASLKALKQAGSVQDFVAIAKEADVLPVKLTSQISKAADMLTKAHEDVGLSIDKRNAEVDIWIQKKQQADQAEFEAKEARQRAEDAFVKENQPSVIQTQEAREAEAMKRQQETQVGQPNTVAETVASAREQGGGAGYVPDSNRIPSQLETDVITVDANGNPVSNAGQDKGWGANKRTNADISKHRTAEQDIKDNFLNAGMRNPEYGAEIVPETKMLPPSKTTVTPQTENAADGNPFDTVASATDQINSFTTGGIDNPK